jgi:hypothetical protein
MGKGKPSKSRGHRDRSGLCLPLRLPFFSRWLTCSWGNAIGGPHRSGVIDGALFKPPLGQIQFAKYSGFSHQLVNALTHSPPGLATAPLRQSTSDDPDCCARIAPEC